MKLMPLDDEHVRTEGGGTPIDRELLRLMRIRNSIVILTTKGAKSGKLRKIPLMRVKNRGVYLAVASHGGSRKNPQWYYNVLADPRVKLQDGDQQWELTARELVGDEKTGWWSLAVAEFPRYEEYQRKAGRQIPVFILEQPAGGEHECT